MSNLWTVRLCTERGSHLVEGYRGHTAERKARRCFDFIHPVPGSGIAYVELIKGGKHDGQVIQRKDR